MKTATFIGLNRAEEKAIYPEQYPCGSDILFIGFDTKVEDIDWVLLPAYDRIILLYSGSSNISNIFEEEGIKFERIDRYCDGAVVTHQIEKILEITKGTRDLDGMKYFIWGKGVISHKFKNMFPTFDIELFDPNLCEEWKDDFMRDKLKDKDVILINHSHHQFKMKWLRDNKNQQKGLTHVYNTTIVINSARANATDFFMNGESYKYPNFYSDVDEGCPHDFYATTDTFVNISKFVNEVINERK